MSSFELTRLVAEGKIASDTLVIEADGSEWRKFSAAGLVGIESLPPVPSPVSIVEKGHRRWPAVVCVLALFPFGLIALWLSKGYTRIQKAIMTVASLPLFILGIAIGSAPLIILTFLLNCILFTWWSKAMRTTVKSVVSVALFLFFLPPLILSKSKTNEFSSYTPSASDYREYVQSQSSSTPAVPKERKVLKVGQKFRLGDFTYKILGYSNAYELGGGYSHTLPSSGAMFFLVQYEITNEGKRTQTVMCDDFLIRDSQGREFSPSSKGTTALIMSERDQDLVVRELQPGLCRIATTVFELPFKALSDKLVLIVPEKGWGAGQREVLLRDSQKN